MALEKQTNVDDELEIYLVVFRCLGLLNPSALRDYSEDELDRAKRSERSPKVHLEVTIAHALEKTKIAMNSADFIITSTFQEIAGRFIDMDKAANFITALTHLIAPVLLFLDISVCNKTDLQSLEEIAEDDKKLALKTLIGQGGEVRDGAEVLLTMSTLTEEGVMNVKNDSGCGSFGTNTTGV
ncbi:nucleolar GTP-binding protein 1-like protein [Tanacetum coccineum]